MIAAIPLSKPLHHLNREALQAFNEPDTFVPDHLRAGLERFINHGLVTGGFLNCVLCNDLTGACTRADTTSVRHIATIVRWLLNHAPANAWGTPAKVNEWGVFAAKQNLR